MATVTQWNSDTFHRWEGRDPWSSLHVTGMTSCHHGRRAGDQESVEMHRVHFTVGSLIFKMSLEVVTF